jgi:hypothetical protein
MMQNQLSKDHHTKDYAKSLIYQILEISCHWNFIITRIIFFGNNEAIIPQFNLQIIIWAL